MKKAFTFVELLLVMLVLGIIISLTLPIIKGIKDDKDIYRAYMKKANQDVTDAVNMISIKENKFRGFEMVKGAFEGNDRLRSTLTPAYIDTAPGHETRCNTLRNLFNVGLDTYECGTCRDVASNNCYKDTDNKVLPCITTDFSRNNVNEGITGQPGLVIGGKPVLVFLYSYDDGTGAARVGTRGTATDPIYGYVYVDMNKDKGPNEYCKDRYKFIIYNDRVAMETDKRNGGCSLTLEEE